MIEDFIVFLAAVGIVTIFWGLIFLLSIIMDAYKDFQRLKNDQYKLEKDMLEFEERVLKYIKLKK